MANTKHETVIARGIVVLMATVYMLSHQGTEGEPVSDEKHSNLKHRGTVKTIVSEEDVIDCVDFYQQPAFDDPLIRNSFQMMPTSNPSGMQSNSTRPKLTQPWHKHGECPKGTIPIRRSSRHDHHKAFPFLESNQNSHEYVEASTDIGQYYGAQAELSVWNPRTETHDFSLSQFWVTSQASTRNLNSIETGWIVYPNRYRDFLTRFFIYWTSDDYRTTGCYDLDCTGFVQIDNTFTIGGAIDPVSVYNGEQFEISISVYKSPGTGRWLLEVEGTPIGYWPSTIFTSLATAATRISWGGEISYALPSAGHTTTHMGSGHFGSEGFGKSSYFKDIATMDTSGALRFTNHINQHVTNPACYDINFDPSKIPITFYYGGPGFSLNCR